MIPKPGSLVRINPAFAEFIKGRWQSFIPEWQQQAALAAENGMPIAVHEVRPHGDLATVTLGDPLNKSFDIWLDTGGFFQYDHRSPPMFVGEMGLKVANTRPEAIRCAFCGGLLKDPGMGPLYKHCPRCEP